MRGQGYSSEGERERFLSYFIIHLPNQQYKYTRGSEVSVADLREEADVVQSTYVYVCVSC